jgi:hypothetical protein
MDTIKNMKSLLRIIIGVLAGIAVFVGIAFGLGLLLRHFDVSVSFAKADYVGRCLDNAFWIGSGIAIFLFMPRQIKRKLEAGKITEEKAKKASKLVLPLGCVCIGMGILRIVGFLP